MEKEKTGGNTEVTGPNEWGFVRDTEYDVNKWHADLVKSGKAGTTGGQALKSSADIVREKTGVDVSKDEFLSPEMRDKIFGNSQERNEQDRDRLEEILLSKLINDNSANRIRELKDDPEKLREVIQGMVGEPEDMERVDYYMGRLDKAVYDLVIVPEKLKERVENGNVTEEQVIAANERLYDRMADRINIIEQAYSGAADNEGSGGKMPRGVEQELALRRRYMELIAKGMKSDDLELRKDGLIMGKDEGELLDRSKLEEKIKELERENAQYINESEYTPKRRDVNRMMAEWAGRVEVAENLEQLEALKKDIEGAMEPGGGEFGLRVIVANRDKIEKLKKAIRKKQGEMKMEELKSKYDGEIGDLSKEEEDPAAKLRSLRRKKGALDSELEGYEDITERRRTIGELEKAIEAKRKEWKKLNKKINKGHDEFREDLRRLEWELESDTREFARLEGGRRDDITDAKQGIKELRKGIRAKEKERKKLRKELEKGYSEHEGDLRRLDWEIESDTRELRQLERELEGNSAGVVRRKLGGDKLEKRVEAAREEQEDVGEKLRGPMDKVGGLRWELTRLNDTIRNDEERLSLLGDKQTEASLYEKISGEARGREREIEELKKKIVADKEKREQLKKDLELAEDQARYRAAKKDAGA